MNKVTRYDLTEDVSTGVVDITPVPERMEGRYVSYEDHATLKAELDALAAENAALISAFMPKEIPTEATDNFSDTAVLRIDGDEFHSWQWVDNQDEVIRGVLNFFKPETPATDTYLNSVRAEGVDFVAEAIGVKCAELKIGSKDWKALKSIVFMLGDFSSKLRAGKDGE